MNYGQRVELVRDLLADQEWDAILLTNASNRRYLTGFSAEDHAADESAGVVVITAGSAELFVSPTNLPWAVAEVQDAAINVVAYEKSWVASVADRVITDQLRVLAIEDATTSAASWFLLQESVPEETRLVRAADAVDALRAEKTPEEIDILARAASLTDEALARALSRFKVGLTERNAADIVREELRHVGSEGEAFDTIVAAGPNAARPHHRPGANRLAEGVPIIVDMGARVDGYNGDLTRTVCLGTPDEKLVTMYVAVLAAQRAGLDAVRAGTDASTPDLATREVFAGHELDQFVIHGAGHGVGLRIHEAPSVGRRAQGQLREGNVVTMEPGLYVPGWGGVRIEDVAVVGQLGHRNLTSAPKGIETLSISPTGG